MPQGQRPSLDLRDVRRRIHRFYLGALAVRVPIAAFVLVRGVRIWNDSPRAFTITIGLAGLGFLGIAGWLWHNERRNRADIVRFGGHRPVIRTKAIGEPVTGHQDGYWRRPAYTSQLPIYWVARQADGRLMAINRSGHIVRDLTQGAIERRTVLVFISVMRVDDLQERPAWFFTTDRALRRLVDL